jgi:hypothetical protein
MPDISGGVPRSPDRYERIAAVCEIEGGGGRTDLTADRIDPSYVSTAPRRRRSSVRVKPVGTE